MTRILMTLAALIALGACAVPDPELEAPVDLGDFRLLGNVGVTTNARKLGVSRDATPEEWEAALEGAIDKRFARYSGETPYTISYSLDGYILATRAGRLALSPRSALSVTVHIWQQEPLERLEERSKQLLVFEGLDGETLLGSGLFRDRDQQMANLAAQFSKAVERWLVANGDLFGVGVSDEALEAAKADDAAEIANQLQAEEAAESN